MHRFVHHLTKLRDLILNGSFLAPLAFLGIYIAILTFLKGAIPPADQIIEHLQGLYGRFGYEIIFLGAFLEGALIIDLFVPGASIVLFGAVFSRTGQIQFPLYLISAFLGFSLGFLVDYLLGYFGWGSLLVSLGVGKELERAKDKVKKFGGKAFLAGYFHPDVATVFVTAAGIIRLDIKEFLVYNALAGLVWLTFWSSLAYFVGIGLINAFRQYFLEMIIASFLVWLFVKWLFSRRS